MGRKDVPKDAPPAREDRTKRRRKCGRCQRDTGVDGTKVPLPSGSGGAEEGDPLRQGVGDPTLRDRVWEIHPYAAGCGRSTPAPWSPQTKEMETHWDEEKQQIGATSKLMGFITLSLESTHSVPLIINGPTFRFLSCAARKNWNMTTSPSLTAEAQSRAGQVKEQEMKRRPRRRTEAATTGRGSEVRSLGSPRKITLERRSQMTRYLERKGPCNPIQWGHREEWWRVPAAEPAQWTRGIPRWLRKHPG
jgi:hypothetical protein